MTVKKLKAMLSKLDDSTVILLSKDSEGNAYSPLAGYDSGYVDRDEVKSYYIDSYFSEGYDFRDNGFESEEEWQEYKKKAKKVIVLCPVN